MKIFKNTLAILAFASLVVLVGCKKGGKDTPDPEDPEGKATAEALAANAWTPTAVSLDDVPRDEWSDFSITFSPNSDFTGGTYSVSGMPTEENSAWVFKPNGGSWEFVENSDGSLDLSNVIKDGDSENVVAIVLNVADDNSSGTLRMTFTAVDPTAKLDGFDGAWVFSFEF
jgi:hypothetical protein